jgi:hypothetical protein
VRERDQFINREDKVKRVTVACVAPLPARATLPFGKAPSKYTQLDLMEPKAKTIIEKHGFKDPDRLKSKHDEIQIWVYKNFHLIYKTLYPSRSIDESDPFKIRLEYVISDRNYVIGFVDVFCERYRVAIEVKTEIPSIGELIRQVHFYRTYLNTVWVVVSPDDRAAQILQDQGIQFFKYPHVNPKLF